MSARQPFFPQAPARSDSRANFVPDPTNSLHAGAKPNVEQPDQVQQQQQRRQSVNNPFSNRQDKPKPATSGLAMLAKRPSGSAGGKGGMTPGAARPDTADPYAVNANGRGFQANGAMPMPHVPLMAPTPQKPARTSSTLLTQNASSISGSASPVAFKVPFASDPKISDKDAGKNAHISTSDVNSTFKSPNDDFGAQNIRFRPASRANGPQRVPMDQGPAMLNAYNKRAREEDELDEMPPANQAKRFKSRDHSEEQDMRNKTRSPNTDRPSSGLSHSMSRSERTSPDSHRHPVQEYQPDPSPPNFKGYSQYEQGIMPQSTPEMSPLQKLLGTDPDAYVKNHMGEYEEMIGRWQGCTIEEWKAGANEIAADYHKLLDHVKIYVDTKLKLYGTFHANVRSHNATLDERKKDLDGARKKLLHESGTVLK
ncbi:hypothetical protein BDN70DRAFT_929389 [Pholiota conissans]|uniref:Extracellular mutant protein 11 C-terminal domain-containing protein n=1 Tax=Pholiota conissans TaxID=109636 RepID=A0A9P5ZAE5_9AGAR|nr:hypothetical protein BDN70DRAFT_929389 [Pholiota conissans]